MTYKLKHPIIIRFSEKGNPSGPMLKGHGPYKIVKLMSLVSLWDKLTFKSRVSKKKFQKLLLACEEEGVTLLILTGVGDSNCRYAKDDNSEAKVILYPSLIVTYYDRLGIVDVGDNYRSFADGEIVKSGRSRLIKLDRIRD